MPKVMPKRTAGSGRGQDRRSRKRRYGKAGELLRKWQRESGDYDEQVWSALGPRLDKTAMNCAESNATTD